MSNLKFTPGPWEVESSPYDYGVYQLRTLSDKHTLLDNALPLYTDEDSNKYDEQYASLVEEDKGNRKLMEAAPEMFELLRSCVEAPFFPWPVLLAEALKITARIKEEVLPCPKE